MTCAKCGDESTKELTMPVVWEDYLREERDFNLFGGGVILLCTGCYPEMDQLKQTAFRLTVSDSPQKSDLPEDMHTALDELTLDQLGDTAL